MRCVVATLVFALAFVVAPARAQLSAQLSATTVAPGEIFQLTLTAEGNSVSAPVLPASTDFIFMNAENPSVSTGISTTFVNGNTSVRRTRSWTYAARIDKEGSFTLPPLQVQIDSKDYTTEPLVITVSNSAPRQSTRSRRMPFGGIDPFSVLQQQRRGQARQQASAPSDDVPIEKLMLFDITAEETEVYQGEAVTLKVSYAYVSSGVSARAEEPKLPAMQGFFVGEGDLMPDTEFEENGLTYKRRTRLFKLFPMEAGDFTIPAVEWPVQITRLGIDDRVVVKKSSAIEIKVKPLPPAPPNFSGAVGELEIASTLPSKDLLQGTPVDFVVTMRGDGNPAAISAPEIPALDWAHLSPSTVDLAQAQAIGALKIFKYVLTPLADGAHEVPALTFRYFSPKLASYVDAVAPAIAVTLRKAVDTGPMVVLGAGGAASTGARLMADLHPIFTDVPELGPARSGLPILLSILLLPPVGYAVLLLQVRRRRRLENDPEFARAFFARSKTAKRLANVRTAPEPGEALFRALVGFVADTLSVPEAGMTSVDARRAIAERGMPNALAESVEKILRACERARYAGAALPEAELCALIDAAVHVMDQIDAARAEGTPS